MKKNYFFFLIICMPLYGEAQNLCGTIGSLPTKTEASLRVANNSTSTSCSYSIRVYFHIVKYSNGTGGQNTSVINTVMNNLNNSFGVYAISFQNMGNDEIRDDTYMSDFYVDPTNSPISVTKFVIT